MNEKEKADWIAQAENSMDFAVRSNPTGSLQDWERIRKRAEEDGLFPSQQEVKMAQKVGIDSYSHKTERVHVKDEGNGAEFNMETFLKSLDKLIAKNNELLKQPEGMGFYDSDTETWKDGTPESKLHPETPGGLIGVWNAEKKCWEGGMDTKPATGSRGTLGIFNTDTGKFEGGVEIARVKDERATVGYFDSETAKWEGEAEPEVDPEKLGTVGIFNSEKNKFEGGAPEEQHPEVGIGTYNKETKTWEGGDPLAIKKLEPGKAKLHQPLR
jgi:hypothetical protein